MTGEAIRVKEFQFEGTKIGAVRAEKNVLTGLSST